MPALVRQLCKIPHVEMEFHRERGCEGTPTEEMAGCCFDPSFDPILGDDALAYQEHQQEGGLLCRLTFQTSNTAMINGVAYEV